MIPFYRTPSAEDAANVLLRHFRHVRIDCTYMNVTRGLDKRVRFKPDLIKDERVFFAKVPSQIKLWQERGGALICWTWRNDIQCDAIVWAEAPKRMEALPAATGVVRTAGVIHEPLSWNAYEEIISVRHAEHPSKRRRALRSLAIIRDYVAGLPILTSQAMQRLLARQAASQSSPSPGSPAAAAHSPDTTG